MRGREDRLIAAWENLTPLGPTFGAPEAGDRLDARDRYLRPLARVLFGALAGSSDHRAVYLDERLRYLDSSRPPAERVALLRATLGREALDVAALADELDRDAVISAWRGLHDPLFAGHVPSASLLFVGDCLFVETRAFLAERLRQRAAGVTIEHVFFSANQAVGSVADAVVDTVVAGRPDVIGLSLFTFEGVPPWAHAWRAAGSLRGPVDPERVADSLTELLRQVVEQVRTVSESLIVVHAPAGLPLGPVRRRSALVRAHSRRQRALLTAMGHRLAELVAGTSNTLLLDEVGIVAAGGGVRAAAAPAFPPSEVPAGYFHTTRLGSSVARWYDGLLVDWDGFGAVKVLLVDFDNTLWDGVMADGAVTHHVGRQQLLRELRQAGILLVALSKNDPAAIRWIEMALTPEDFVLLKINWHPKPDNVSAALIELDLAPGAFVLLDDNPVERALVSERVPGVRTFDPHEEGTWRGLRRLLDFPATRQTQEAAQRTQMYREAAERRISLGGTHDYPTMMASLNLRYSVRRAKTGDIPRLQELMQRTSQFNTTTLRPSTGRIGELVRGTGRVQVYVATMEDRFGSLGVVACAVYDTVDRCLDAVVMSCRAMGFGLELALLADVIAEVGPGPVHATFVPTDRNGPSADLFVRAGFSRTSQDRWTLSLSDLPPRRPDWFTVDG